MTFDEQDSQNRLACLRRAVELYPEDVTARSELGRLLSEMKLHEEALPHFQKAMDLTPGDPKAWENLMFAYAMSDMVSEATDFGEKGLKRWPERQAIVFYLAVTYLDHGRQLDAAQLFDFLLRDDLEDPLFHAMAGVAYASVGWDKEAKREQETATLLGEGDPLVERLVAEADGILGCRSGGQPKSTVADAAT